MDVKNCRRTETRFRDRHYTAAVTIRSLPVGKATARMHLKLLELVRERKDTLVRIDLKDPHDLLSISLSRSDAGIYMELSYCMDRFRWRQPLLLANDHLTYLEAAEILYHLLTAGEDDHPLILHFRNITDRVYDKSVENRKGLGL